MIGRWQSRSIWPWGWRRLLPGEPFTTGAPYEGAETKKVIVLLTDGANAVLKRGEDIDGTTSTSVRAASAMTSRPRAGSIPSRPSRFSSGIMIRGPRACRHPARHAKRRIIATRPGWANCPKPTRQWPERSSDRAAPGPRTDTKRHPAVRFRRAVGCCILTLSVRFPYSERKVARSSHRLGFRDHVAPPEAKGKRYEITNSDGLRRSRARGRYWGRCTGIACVESTDDLHRRCDP